MANFEIGDKVRITSNKDVEKTGVIIAKAFPHTQSAGTNVRTSGELEKGENLYIWKVKLDITHEEKEYFEDQLEKIE